MRIAFDPWRPDLADLDTDLTQVAVNVYPGQNSYRPIAGPQPYSDALATNPRGMWEARSTAGDFVTYVGEASEISKLSGTSWTSLGTGYSVPAGEHWSGVQFGTDFYFNNVTDGLLVSDIDGVGTVSAVGGVAPAAKAMDAVEGYLMCGNISDDPFRVEWSDTEDGQTWGTGNSGGQTFPDGGAVTAILGASHTIIQETGMRRIVYDPGGSIFQFEKIEIAKGSISPYSVIPFGPAFAYLAEDGFWFNNEPIGQNQVNRTFLSTVNEDEIFSVLGRADPKLPIFWWHYRTSQSDIYDAAVLYNWSTRTWSSAQFNILFAASAATTGDTLETLSAAYPNLDTLVPYPLDSRVWLGGRPTYAVIGTDRKLAFMEGNTLAASIDTSERQLVPGYRSRVRAVRPLVNSSAATMSIRARDSRHESSNFTSAISQQASGVCRTNKSGRYHRFRMDVPAGSSWNHAQGVEVPDEAITTEGLR